MKNYARSFSGFQTEANVFIPGEGTDAFEKSANVLWIQYVNRPAIRYAVYREHVNAST